MVIRFIVDPGAVIYRKRGDVINPIEVALRAGRQIPHYVDQTSLDEAHYDEEYLAQVITWPIEPFIRAWHAHDPRSLLNINAMTHISAICALSPQYSWSTIQHCRTGVTGNGTTIFPLALRQTTREAFEFLHRQQNQVNNEVENERPAFQDDEIF